MDRVVTGPMPSATAAVPRWRLFLQLGKPRLSAMAIFAVVAGYYLGVDAPAWTVDVVHVGVLALGTFLVAMAGNALNMYLERGPDARMPRTQARPLPSGRLAPREVAVYGIVIGLIGLGVLAANTNALATATCAAIFVTYVLVYTPLKRRTTLNTLVGAVPGALPPVVGYAAGRGSLDLGAGVLFLILFLWQIPHFLAISWRYREDYRRGGMVMLSVVDESGRRVALQMLLYCSALVMVSTLPYALKMSGDIYIALATCLGVLFLVPCALAALLRSEAAMRQCFYVSIVYLPLLLIAMVLDRGL